MAKRSSPSLFGKLAVALVCFGVLAVGAHMLIKPERYSFTRLGATGPQAGLFQSSVAWMDANVGTRPTGGLLCGAGLLGMIVAARPKPRH
ncbi:MAG: hypothetical protein IT437_10015 [Phycisphaerales bacterium]|nr:hypothetical protein [Phycisphaerales bacterium]